MTRRPRLAKALVVIGSVLFLFGGIALYLDRTVFDSGSFADRAGSAVENPDVRALISDRVADQVVKAQPDLVGVRPVIGAVTDGVIRSAPFRSLFRAGAADLHRSVFSSDRDSVSLAVNDVGVLVIQALERISPSSAKRIPPDLETQLVSISDGSDEIVAKALRVAEDVHQLAVVCLVLAALALIAGVLFAPDRRAVFGWIGLGALGVGLATVAVFIVARLLVTGQAEAGESRDAARAVWDVFLDDLRDWGVLVAAVGAVTAAAAASLVRPVSAGPALQAAWARVSATPERPVLRVLRAVGLMVAGGVVIAARSAVLDLLVMCGGIALVYLGVAEIMRLLAPPPGEVTAAKPRGRRRIPRRAVATGLVAVAVIGAVLIGRGLTGEDDAPTAVSTCNGHRELCDRRLDDVTFAAAHNAMSAAKEPGWLFATHDKGMRGQLDDGVRSLLIDTHYGVETDKGVATDLEAGSKSRAKIEDEVGEEFVDTAERLRRRIGFKEGEGKREIWLCHAYCEVGATKGVEGLKEVRDFVVENPGEVVVLSIEDDVSPKDTAKMFKDSGLLDYVYDGPTTPMPTLRQLIDRGTPVVVYAENKTDREYPWYRQQFGYVQETPFDFKTIDSLLPPDSCRPMRGRKTNPLFLLNHWVETAPAPRPSNARVVNARSRLLTRARECGRRRGLKPNLVAVDFYATGDLFATVDELNGVR